MKEEAGDSLFQISLTNRSGHPLQKVMLQKKDILILSEKSLIYNPHRKEGRDKESM